MGKTLMLVTVVTDILYNIDIITSIAKLIVHSPVGKLV